MANFPDYKPTYSATKTSAPKVRKAQFGDGYEQRVRFGLNQNPKEWRLTFNVSDADATVIEAFLDARADDGTSFDWTPPDGTTSYKWVCESWTRELFEFQQSRVDVTFRQVFEP
jgi:phage-related protein